MKKKVITFGEIMLRLATPDYLRFCQTNQYNATFGGGEANVAVSLANYGIETEFGGGALDLVLMPVIGNHIEREPELPSAIEPCCDLGRGAGAVAWHERIVTIEQQRAFTLRVQLLEVDHIDRRHIACRGKDTHDSDASYSWRNVSNSS